MLSGIVVQIDRRKDISSQLLSFSQNIIKKYYSIINYLKIKRKKESFSIKVA